MKFKKKDRELLFTAERDFHNIQKWLTILISNIIIFLTTVINEKSDNSETWNGY